MRSDLPLFPAVFLALTGILLLAAPTTAQAQNDDDEPVLWSSEPIELFFEDDEDVFSALDFDTGFVPSGSPVSIRFYLLSEGGVHTVLG